MNPWEHTKFFYRMESDVGFRKFYRGIYDGLRLVWCNSLEEKTECTFEEEWSCDSDEEEEDGCV